MSRCKLTHDQMAKLVAQEIADGSYVNLGIGIPLLVAKYIPDDREVILHSENGIIGMRMEEVPGPPDTSLINAGKQQIVLVPGAAIIDHPTSFAIMRGGHLDVTVLGALQVAANGDLANWDTGNPNSIPGVGGAMDLVVGARRIIVMMDHVAKDGSPKLLERCTFPLTGSGVVDTIYTDLAIIDVEEDGLHVRAMVEGLSFDELQTLTAAQLTLSLDNERAVMKAPA